MGLVLRSRGPREGATRGLSVGPSLASSSGRGALPRRSRSRLTRFRLPILAFLEGDPGGLLALAIRQLAPNSRQPGTISPERPVRSFWTPPHSHTTARQLGAAAGSSINALYASMISLLFVHSRKLDTAVQPFGFPLVSDTIGTFKKPNDVPATSVHASWLKHGKSPGTASSPYLTQPPQ